MDRSEEKKHEEHEELEELEELERLDDKELCLFLSSLNLTNALPDRCTWSTSTDFFARSILFPVSVVAGLPYLAPAREYAGDSDLLKHIYGSSELLSIALVTYFVLDDILTQVRTKFRLEGCYVDKNLLASMFFGFLTAFPNTLIGYIYNPAAPYLALISLFEMTVMNTFSISRNFFSPLTQKLFNSSFNKAVLEFRAGYLANLRKGLNRLVISQEQEIRNFLDGLAFSPAEDQMAPELFREKLNEIYMLGKACSNGKFHKYIKAASAFIGFTFPLGWLPTISIFVYDNVNDLIDLPWLSGVITAVTVIPGYLLESYFVMLIANDLISNFTNLITKRYTKNLPMQHATWIYSSLFLLGAMLSAFSFASRATIVDDIFPDNELLNIIFKTWGCTITTTLRFYIILELNKQVITFLLARLECVREPIPKLSRFYQSFDRYIGLLNEMSEEMFYQHVIDGFELKGDDDVLYDKSQEIREKKSILELTSSKKRKCCFWKEISDSKSMPNENEADDSFKEMARTSFCTIL